MTRDEIIKLKALAFDRMRLCHSVFIGNKPPLAQHAQELLAHAAFYSALCAELGEPIPQTPKNLRERLGSVLKALRAILSKEWCKPLDFDFIDALSMIECLFLETKP